MLSLAFAVVLMPSPAGVLLVDDPHPYFKVALLLSDLPLAVLVALSVPDAIARLRTRRFGAIGALTVALVSLVAAAFLVNPSPQGAQTLFRVIAGLSVALTLHALRLDRERRFVLVALAMTAIVQMLLAVAQLARGDALVAYEHPPLFEVGPYIRPGGTLANGFVLAGLALVASSALAGRALSSRRTLAWTAAAALAVVPVGITFSRAAALGIALGAAVLVPGALRSRAQALVLASLVLAAGVPALLVADGWIVRGTEHSTAASADARYVLAVQTIPLIRREPLLGVGPGRTMASLRDLERDVPGSILSEQYLEPPHNLPLVIALEAGIPAGLVSVALIGLAALRALRRGAAAQLAFTGLLPFVALDHYLWTTPTGLMLLALWAWLVIGEGAGDLAAGRSAP
ncbi:MAG TPA: O-antigen ligase family protein [Candidatus Limnocylindrales bacterium]|nr:O-antigen ligase family protein [Candidatus Limnocylindrales bacterium]